MEPNKLIVNSNNSCLVCFERLDFQLDLTFPFHKLASKLNINLTSIFPDVKSYLVDSSKIGQLKLFANLCQVCSELCEDLIKLDSDGAVKLLLDKLIKVELVEEYNGAGPLALIHLGVVDRIRNEMIKIFKPKLGWKEDEDVEKHLEKTILDVPELPFDKICSYLCLIDLKNLSASNKQLRQAALPSLISSSIITFTRSTQVTAAISFIKFMTTKLNKKVALSLTSDSFEASPKSHSTLLNLFKECGHLLNHLKITYNYGMGTKNGFRNNNTLNLEHDLFPNLKFLELTYLEISFADDSDFEEVDEDTEDKVEASSPFIKGILKNSPNLTSISMDCDHHGEVTSLLLELIQNSGIRNLEIDGANISEGNVNFLHKLKLEKLILNGFFHLESDHLTQLLESQRLTLNYLWIRQSGYAPSLPHFTYPRMEALETYKLAPYKEDINEHLINYQNLPKLKRLEISYRNYGDAHTFLMSIFQPGIEPSNSVKELRISLPIFHEHYVSRAAIIFPHLSKLEVPVDLDFINAYENLTGLEELIMYPSGNSKGWIDEIITGLHSTSYQDHTKTITEDDMEGYQEEYDERGGARSLALLKKLKTFRISTPKYSDNGELMVSDISFRLVLMKMDSLKLIDFCGRDPAFVGASRKVLDEMGQKIALYFGTRRGWHY